MGSSDGLPGAAGSTCPKRSGTSGPRLLGTWTVHEAFTQEVTQTMSTAVKRPVVFPISNPTPWIEAMPADVIAWTRARRWSPEAAGTRTETD